MKKEQGGKREEERGETYRTKLVTAPAPAPANINSPIPNFPPTLPAASVGLKCVIAS